MSFSSPFTMELDLVLALPATNSVKCLCLNSDDRGAALPRKRSLCKAFVHKHGDDDDDNNDNIENPHNLNKLKRVLIGWPPIKCRKNDINNSANNGRNLYVKVKMEGVAIGRKLDLSILGSYQALNFTLRLLFPIKHSDDDNVAGGGKEQENYVVTYEDEEGDWMLVGDVPWESFIRSVKRLKILGNQSQY